MNNQSVVVITGVWSGIGRAAAKNSPGAAAASSAPYAIRQRHRPYRM